MMRVAVAGATGFIGRAAVAALRSAGHDVFELSRDDLADPRQRAIGSDVLVWAAGRREPDLAANREIHVALPLRAVERLHPGRVVYLSSGECYGDAPLPYVEEGPALGTSDYAIAKLEGERALASACPTTVLRVAPVYGPGQTGPMLVPSVVAKLRAGAPVPLTHGRQTRDLVYVDDVAEAIVAAVGARAIPLVNIGTGVETPIRDICLALADAVGAPRDLLRFGETEMRAGEAMRYVLDVSRAQRELGWAATTPLAVGFSRL